MMKRFIAIILTFHFLVLSIGVGVSTHLCGGRAVSKAIFVEAPACGHSQEKKGCEDHQSDKKGCCDHDYELVKLEAEYLLASDVALNHQLPLVAILVDAVVSNTPFKLPANYIHNSKPPPQGLSQRLALFQSYLC